MTFRWYVKWLFTSVSSSREKVMHEETKHELAGANSFAAGLKRERDSLLKERDDLLAKAALKTGP